MILRFPGFQPGPRIERSMRLLCWLLSFLLHAGVAAAAVYLATPGVVKVNLNIPVYEVDLVRLEPAKRGRPKAEVKPVKPEPAPQAVPKPAPQQAAPALKPVPAPSPPPPKPEAKEISTKKEPPKPEKKPAPAEAKKPEPKPAKPEKTREQLLAEALSQTKKDVTKLDRQEQLNREKERQALQGEIQALRETVGREESAADDTGEEGAGGDADEGEGTVGLLDIYRIMVRDTIKENWRYPDISAKAELSARVVIELGPDGSIIDYSLTESSGRPDFDASTLAAIKATRSLPPPPSPDIKVIHITFNLQDMLK